MLRHSRLVARSTLAAGLAAAALLTAGPAFAAVPATSTGPAAAAAGSYGSWTAAQRAAGFKLKKPHRLFGLTRTHPILVGRCNATGQRRKHDVYAQWNNKNGQTYLSIDQNNSGKPCSNFGAAKYLGSWRIQGRKARMYGFCGRGKLPSCTSKKATRVLAWKGGSRYYVDYSHNEWRRTLVSFARGMRFV
jgi:hypothetical protein